ncbi:MAG TPA: molecular chaperone HtpG [bacterium]|nr:molecular chaperone HtpG [bacterium]
MAETSTQTFEFKAEIQQLLHILSHSLYTHREIFIRELISNAADALDKARFKTIKGEPIVDSDLEFAIWIDVDESKKTFTIRDSGIGMSQEELVKNIGTIAHSGTSEFLKQMAVQQDAGLNLIGRFGVGFYSVFMVAERVELTSRSAEAAQPAHVWSSDGQGAYDIQPADEAPRGTTVKVFLREDAQEFCQKQRVESLIKKYSNFVPFPIRVNGEQINKISAIWREPKAQVSEEQYNEFFKFIAVESENPLTWLHFSADAPIQFHALLFVPSSSRESLGFGHDEEGMQLFVRRVLVDHHAKDILPDYLRFVRGVLDSDDLPLNISRETLQENPHLLKIKNTLVAKFLSHLQELARTDEAKYLEIWRQHGRVLKEGYADFTQREKLAELLRFNSSKSADEKELISLQTYVERMPEKQAEIYYLSGPTRETVSRNPILEIFKAKEIEVLYCYEPIDEFALPGMMEYKGKKFKSADQADVKTLNDLPDKTAEKPAADYDKKDMDRLARRIKDILGDKVEDVRVSERLVDSPALLVGTDSFMSSQMQRIMMHMQHQVELPKRNLEINPRHPLLRNMEQIYRQDPQDPFLTQLALRLFDSAQWVDGYVGDPLATATGLQELLQQVADMYVKRGK